MPRASDLVLHLLGEVVGRTVLEEGDDAMEVSSDRLADTDGRSHPGAGRPLHQSLGKVLEARAVAEGALEPLHPEMGMPGPGVGAQPLEDLRAFFRGAFGSMQER
jgi:hypothetical protein